MTDFPIAGAAPAYEAANIVTPANSFGFHGSRKTFFWMLFKFFLLQLITLGIYRFWAKTHTRRYLWGSVELEGDRFEYLGTAKELFIGFLIAVAVLLPLGIADAAIRPNLESYTWAFAYQAVYILGIVFLIYFATFRIWRYRLTRTAWRGVRFHLDGSAVKYACLAIFYSLLSMLTLGLFYPWAKAKLVQFKTNKAFAGHVPFSTELQGGALIKAYIPLIALSIIFYGSMAYIWFGELLALAWGNEELLSSQMDVIADETKANPLVYLWPLLLLALYPILYVRYMVFEFNTVVNSVRLGGCKIACQLKAWDVAKAYLLYFAPMFALFGLAITTGIFLTFLLPFLFLGFMFSGVLFRVIVEFSIIKLVFKSLEIENDAILDEITQSDKEISKHGEGFADAFDVGAF